MPTFNLKLPQLDSLQQEAIPQPKDLEAWITKLPSANITGTAKSLYRVIKNLNRAAIAPQTRAQLTELLATPIDHTVRALENNHIYVSFPLPAKTMHIAFICTRLIEELGFAYKWVIHSLTKQELSHTDRKLLISSLFYAIHRLAALIYAHNLLYQPPPTSVWFELHTLFKFADANNWASTPLPALLGPKGEVFPSTSRDFYLQALLFVTAAPIRLHQREMRALYLNLPHWTKEVRLQPLVDLVPSPTRFVVQLKRDQPPQHSTLLNRLPKGTALELDTEHLVQMLQTRCDNISTESSDVLLSEQWDNLSKATLRRFIQAWGTAPQRYFARTRLNFELPLVVGFSAIIELLAGANWQTRDVSVFSADTPDFQKKLPDTEDSTSFIKTQNSGFDAIDPDRYRGVALLSLEPNKSASHITHKDSAPAPTVWAKATAEESITASPYITLNTINESIGGYCVDWSKRKVPCTKIGELVGIPSPTTPPSCALAVVRWIYDAPEQGLQVGLQVLAPNVEAVIVTDRARTHHVPIPCLLIPEVKSTKNPASLIAPPLALRINDDEGGRLFLQEGDAERRVKLLEILEVSSTFVRFRFDCQ